MKNFIATISLVYLVAASPTYAAGPNVPKKSDSAAGFAPKGWDVEKAVRGDLNGDARADLALIIRKNDPALIIKNPHPLGVREYNSNPRSIIIALKQSDGRYLHIAQNDYIIPLRENDTMDDPIDGITVDKNDALTIVKGVLRVKVGFWASAGTWGMFHRTFSFRLNKKHFQLIGFDSDYVNRGSGDFTHTSINYLTRRKKIQKGSISDEVIPEKWTRIMRKPLIAFDDVGNGFEFKSQ